MQNKSLLTQMLVTLLALLPITAAAQGVKLAEWNMGGSDDIAVTWFAQGGAPSIAPDECVGEKSDYVLTAWSENRYWQLCTGWENKVLRIENTAANAIADYTDGSQHNVYYEVQFPTKGYKNITVDFVVAGLEEYPMEAYRLSGEGAKDLAVGDTVTVTGTLTRYKDTREFGKGCTLDAVVKGE